MQLKNVLNLYVWRALMPYLPAGTRLTSVYRPAEEQLKILVDMARGLGFKFEKAPTVSDEKSWQKALDFVRSKGKKIAAPGRSAHQRAIAYDFSGASLEAIAAGVRRAVSDGAVTLAKGSRTPILIEKANNCVHVEIESAKTTGFITYAC
ncbi:MAG: hypothetical protein IPN76_26340 [Saprospiraceae bacterium]|nr:hypothetical protein [Saprospiraceae bacterium]